MVDYEIYFGYAPPLRRGACAVRWYSGSCGVRWPQKVGADTCSLCTMATPRISCAPQPSPSRHSRSKDVEAVQVNGALASMTNFIAKYFSHWKCQRIYNLSRGRVGRSGREGFTYLFYTDKSLLSRIAMGALDCGRDIPHSDKRFAGFKKDKKQLGAEIHRKYIYEGHVADYMKVQSMWRPKLKLRKRSDASFPVLLHHRAPLVACLLSERRGGGRRRREHDAGKDAVEHNQVIIGWEQKGEQAMTLFKFGFGKESRQ